MTFSTQAAGRLVGRGGGGRGSDAFGLASPIAFSPRQTAATVGFGIDLMEHDVGLLPQLWPER